jgi:hypothetical protein
VPDHALGDLAGCQERAVCGELDQNTRITVTVMVRQRAEVPSELIAGRQTLAPDELAARLPSDPAQLEHEDSVTLVMQAIAHVSTRQPDQPFNPDSRTS